MANMKMAKSSFLAIVMLLGLGNIGLREESLETGKIYIETSYTVAETAQKNGVPAAKLLKALKLSPTDDSLRLFRAGLDTEQVGKAIRKIKVLQVTESSKNWRLILSKFALWLAALATATVMLIKNKITTRIRLVWMTGTAVLFGFILGSDPNPMGTVKDAIVLFGREGVVFPPRMLALGAFLIFVFLSNKSICGWGCHFGALQDAVNSIPAPKIKLPFWLTNGIRAMVMGGIIIVIFVWSFDWVGFIDPFKIFSLKPSAIGLGSIIFTLLLSVIGIFFYRPWCQMLCPFGLTGWVIEQFSLLKPRIKREGCIKCGQCVKSCPTRAMEGIYNGRKLHADCFACGNCIKVCPAKVINWSKYKFNKTGEER